MTEVPYQRQSTAKNEKKPNKSKKLRQNHKKLKTAAVPMDVTEQNQNEVHYESNMYQPQQLHMQVPMRRKLTSFEFQVQVNQKQSEVFNSLKDIINKLLYSFLPLI